MDIPCAEKLPYGAVSVCWAIQASFIVKVNSVQVLVIDIQALTS
jgi:hypothetical protein